MTHDDLQTNIIGASRNTNKYLKNFPKTEVVSAILAPSIYSSRD